MQTLSLLTIGLCAATFAASIEKANLQTTYVFHHENVMGTSLELKFVAISPEQAQVAEQAALDQIDHDSKILSTYDPNSEVSRWLKTSGKAITVSPELFEVLSMFDQWRQRTDGALNASSEVVSQVWKNAERAQRLPIPAELAAAVASAKLLHWKLDGSLHTATHLTDVPVRLNSFAKSYIVNRAAENAMAVAHVAGVVVNVGGDMVVRGTMTETIEVANPRSDSENSAPLARLAVSGMAVATSGSYRRGFDIGGKHYSHIIDPRTGQTADQIVSATVVTENAGDSGALATSFSILKIEESQRLASSMKNVEYLLIAQDGKRIQSPGWQRLELPMMMAAASQASGAGLWPTGFELQVNLELAHIEGQRTRRPYVAIWIEDKDKFPVKTISLWVEKSKWIPDLKSWYHDDRMRNMSEGSDLTNSLTSATRAPGKYTMKWDGKDNAGKLVKVGKYTVCLEVAREHGTYQIIRLEMDFSGNPKQITLNGNTEVASASVDYRRISH